MSEMPPEQGGGGMMSRRFLGLPVPVVIAGFAVVAYFLFFRNSSSPSSSSGSGQATTGNITLNPGTTSVSVSNPVNNSSSSGKAVSGGGSGRHGTHNPQPHPPTRHKKKTTSHKINHRATQEFVTVGHWPGHSVNGLAQWNTTLWGISRHTHTSIAELLKLNPSIKNPNLIYAGEKIRYR